jgi:hypothetical protein
MHIRRVAIAASLSLVFAALLASAPAAAQKCEPIAAKAATTWHADTGVEVGQIQGFINGVLYLYYDDEAPPVNPDTTKPNLVIQTKDGNLDLWVYSDRASVPRGTREFAILQMSGTGMYKSASGDLQISGRFSRRAGGEYTITGSICADPGAVSR